MWGCGVRNRFTPSCLQPPHYICRCYCMTVTARTCTPHVSWLSFPFVNTHAAVSQKGLGTDLRWVNFPNCSESKPESSWSFWDIRTLWKTASLWWHLGRSPTACFVFVFQRGNCHVIHQMFPLFSVSGKQEVPKDLIFGGIPHKIVASFKLVH